MLVVSRRSGQSIHIGEEIEISVIETGPNRVKLGIRAPKDIPVLRGEIRLTQEENLKAARGASGEWIRRLVERVRGAHAAVE